MADKLISALPEASSIASNDLLVTEQTSIAKKITADNLLLSLASLWTDHGGIDSFALYSTSGLSKTYRMTYADATYTDITITDGTGITSIVTTTSGLTHTVTITLNDGTTEAFTVDDGVGISSISGPTSVGLDDTYTINLSDGSTSTFTVTNGASVSSITLNGTTITFTKDDSNTIDLPVPTLRIRYSATQPDDDNDIISTPSNYMGVAWALDSTTLHYTDYAWFKIKGETGDDAQVSTYARQYKYDADGTQYPTSGYYSTIAAAQSAVSGNIQGKYLWIATTITWNNGTPSVIYTSSYQGIDGTGLTGVVKSLYLSDTGTSLSPDANGQVTVSSADMGAIKAPSTASDGQVLTWDSTNQVWYAGSVSTGTVNSVNSKLPDANGNIALNGTNIPIDSTPTSNVAVVTDSSGKLKASSVTSTEVGYLSGATSNIQDQLDAKAAATGLTDGSVTKVGTGTVGSEYKRIYLNSGTPTSSNNDICSLNTAAFSSLAELVDLIYANVGGSGYCGFNNSNGYVTGLPNDWVKGYFWFQNAPDNAYGYNAYLHMTVSKQASNTLWSVLISGNDANGYTVSAVTEYDAPLTVKQVSVASSGWTASTITSNSGTTYTYKYDVTVSGMTAYDFIDIGLTNSTGATYTGNYCVQDYSGGFCIRVASQPSVTTNWYVYYTVGKTAS